jgi:hypothetical protein
MLQSMVFGSGLKLGLEPEIQLEVEPEVKSEIELG